MSYLHRLLTDAIYRAEQEKKTYVKPEDKEKIQQLALAMNSSANSKTRREAKEALICFLELLMQEDSEAIYDRSNMYNGKVYEQKIADLYWVLKSGI